MLNSLKLIGQSIVRSKLKMIPYTCRKLTKTSNLVIIAPVDCSTFSSIWGPSTSASTSTSSESKSATSSSSSSRKFPWSSSFVSSSSSSGWLSLPFCFLPVSISPGISLRYFFFALRRRSSANSYAISIASFATSAQSTDIMSIASPYISCCFFTHCAELPLSSSPITLLSKVFKLFPSLVMTNLR